MHSSWQALKISSYAVMSEDEMTYVEGGKLSWTAAKGLAVTALTAIVSGIVGYGSQIGEDENV